MEADAAYVVAAQPAAGLSLIARLRDAEQKHDTFRAMIRAAGE